MSDNFGSRSRLSASESEVTSPSVPSVPTGGRSRKSVLDELSLPGGVLIPGGLGLSGMSLSFLPTFLCFAW